MKITLIPCGTNQLRPCFGHHLGTMYLASVAREWTNFEPDVKILDMRTRQMSVAQVLDELKGDIPDVVGLSAKTCEVQTAIALSKGIRKLNPNALIIAGGAQPTIGPEAMFIKSAIDIAVIGEGEVTFVDILEKLHSGAGFENTPGTMVRSGGELIQGPVRPYIQDVDSIPFPAWDLIDNSLFENLESSSYYLAEHQYMSMFTSRACPFNCIYCHHIFGKSFRPRSPQNVLEEIDILYNERGIREFHIQDDVFNFNRQRVFDICDGILERNYKISISFPSGLRGDILDQEIITKLRSAGAYYIGFGVETASPRLQKLIGKPQDLEKLRQVATMCDKAGFITAAFFMLGFPTETREELDQTVEYALSLPLTRIEVAQVCPFPGTRLYEWAKETYPDVDISLQDGRFATNFSVYELATGIHVPEYIRRINVRFYLNPFRMWKLFWRVPRKYFIFKGFITWIKLLFPSFWKMIDKTRPKDNEN